MIKSACAVIINKIYFSETNCQKQKMLHNQEKVELLGETISFYPRLPLFIGVFYPINGLEAPKTERPVSRSTIDCWTFHWFRWFDEISICDRCVCVSVFVFVCICSSVCLCAYIFIYVSICTWVCLLVHKYLRARFCVHAFFFVHSFPL